ncbi:hypothetical protein C7M61_004988 [Candidozyma pseudohaemuli]|uniref:Uncharacterized protein n=1 Tax=Candidozyma pseudohaemuli TaxID=418784 RepID=A0A2P7YF97_9ASCO|nr:hypothetical protein C7M61_004988 [[Candida] pseudohaemulonii]PSK34628.1 hypothetical protein C7M61_004988 [[Candida] pseudohaemulonii]
MPNNPPPIPGFYYDDERGRYFAITNGENRFNKRYTNNAVQAQDRRKRQDRRNKEHEKKLKKNLPLALNRQMTTPYNDPEGSVLALRLGETPFSYLPEIVSKLKNLKYFKKIDYAIHPYGFGLKGSENEVVFYEPLTRNAGTTPLPLEDYPLIPKGQSSTHERTTFKGIKTDTLDYIFFDSYMCPFQAINNEGTRYELNWDLLRTLGAVDAFDPDDIRIYSWTVSADTVYILTDRQILFLLLENFHLNQKPALALDMPVPQGDAEDAVVDESGLSFIRGTHLCFVALGDYVSWDLTIEIFQHFKYTRVVGDITFVTFALITNQGVIVRELMIKEGDDTRWTGDGSMVSRQEHNNLMPIAFLYNAILICEEDRGNFVAIDLKEKRIERFECSAIRNLNLSEPHFEVIFHDNKMYLSTETTTFVFE